MSKDKHARPVEVKNILRSMVRIDLVLATDNLTGQTDVRQSVILDLYGDQVIVEQTRPPIGPTHIGERLEASVIHRDIVTSEISRWGWTATVRSFDNNYIINSGEPTPKTASVIGLSVPDVRELTKSNIRSAYRLDTSEREGIHVAVRPMPAPVRLVNFSADGLQLATAAPSPYAIGQELPFRLTFPAGAVLSVYRIEGLAEVVRLEQTRDHGTAYLGLKFKRLKSEAKWALPKIIQYYMLEEQRKRRTGD